MRLRLSTKSTSVGVGLILRLQLPIGSLRRTQALRSRARGQYSHSSVSLIRPNQTLSLNVTLNLLLHSLEEDVGVDLKMIGSKTHFRVLEAKIQTPVLATEVDEIGTTSRVAESPCASCTRTTFRTSRTTWRSYRVNYLTISKLDRAQQRDICQRGGRTKMEKKSSHLGLQPGSSKTCRWAHNRAVLAQPEQEKHRTGARSATQPKRSHVPGRGSQVVTCLRSVEYRNQALTEDG